MLVVIALAILLLKKQKHQNEADILLYNYVIIHLTDFKCCFLSLRKFPIKRFKRKPPRRGQPVYKGQMARPQCVLCSEVLL